MYVDAVKELKESIKATILNIYQNNYGLINYTSFNRGESDFFKSLFYFLWAEKIVTKRRL